MRSLLIVLLLTASAFAQPKAVITGPQEALVGDLVVLTGAESNGDGFRWIAAPGVQTLQCGDGMDLAFASGRPGTYTFMLIAADKEASIDYAQHSVIVRAQGTQPEPPKPDDPEQPTLPPDAFRELEQLSRDSAGKLNDAGTAKGLAEAIQQTADSIARSCDSGTCPGLAVAKQMMVATIEQTLLLRTGRSRSVDWLNGWRVPINDKLKQINAADVPTYLKAMRAVAAGLAR